QRRMICKHMPATRLAPFSVAHRSLIVGADVFGALGDFDRGGVPKGEGIDRAAGPMAAGLAVTISHSRRRAGNRELHSTAETAPFVFSHDYLPKVAIIRFQPGSTAKFELQSLPSPSTAPSP